MFIGHYGVALAAKAVEPSLPLSGLMLATQATDVLWSSLVLGGVEKMRLTRGFTKTNDLDLYYIPYSHGLLTSLALSVLISAATLVFLPGCTLRAAIIMGAVCWSHWWLDLLVHVKDLPLMGNSYKVGFGLWNYKWPAQTLEIALFLGGAALYLASLQSGSGLWWFGVGLTLLLLALHLYAISGPPPESIGGFVMQALVAYIVVGALCWGGEAWLRPA